MKPDVFKSYLGAFSGQSPPETLIELVDRILAKCAERSAQLCCYPGCNQPLGGVNHLCFRTGGMRVQDTPWCHAFLVPVPEPEPDSEYEIRTRTAAIGKSA